MLAGNPHADAHGNPGVWYFYTEPDKAGSGERVIPAGSLLARWQSAATAEERQRLAQEIEGLLEVGSPAGERQSGRPVVSPALLAARTAGQRRRGCEERQAKPAGALASDPKRARDRSRPEPFRQAPERRGDRPREPLRASAPGAGGSPAGRPCRGL